MGVWVGELSTGSDGEFDPMTAEFSKGKVYDFPRAATCAVQYCNIEGIEWVDDGGADEDAPRTLVGVSDKMIDKGTEFHLAARAYLPADGCAASPSKFITRKKK